jgi:hypothetical protein
VIEVHPVLGGLMVISIIVLIATISRFMILKQRYLKNEIEYHKISFENKNKTTEYSTQLLELIRTIVAQIAVVKYRNFRDSNDMSKITEAMIKNLIKDIAKTARTSLNLENMLWGDTLFKREFIENYIVDMTVLLVKESVRKTLVEEN